MNLNNRYASLLLHKNTDELKKLILDNPELPIVVLAGDKANNGGYQWIYCNDISFEIGEILDCDMPDEDCVFTDRDRLGEYLDSELYEEYEKLSEAKYEALLKSKIAEFEPYWKKVIAIYATN